MSATRPEITHLAKLRQVGPGQWQACCPAHEDTTPSLSIRETDDGKLLWHCHAGCDQAAVQAAIGIEPQHRERGPFYLAKIGEPSQTWAYRSAEGRTLGTVARYEAATGKTIRFWQPDGTCKALSAPRPLYNLDRLAANPAAVVLVVEGEKAAEAAGRLFPDMVATTWPGGAKAAGKADWSPLTGRELLLWPDNDDPGRQAMIEVQRVVGGRLLEPPADKPNGWDAADATAAEARALLASATASAGAPRIIAGPDHSRIRADLFDAPPQPPAMIVRDFEPQDAGVMPGTGGTGKTTLELAIAVQTILGWAIFGALDVLKPGPVLVISAEDGRERIEYRLHRVCEAFGLGDTLRRRVLDNLHVEDLSRTRARLVAADAYGNLSRTALADQIATAYRGRGLARIVLDPAVYFGPGERYVNDGEAELLHAGRFLSAELQCAVKFLAHVGKVAARTGANDQHAGRGGAALADNSRFVHILTRCAADTAKPPADVRLEEVAEGRILRLDVAKLTDAPLPATPLWLRRTGWRFDLVPVTAQDPEAVRTHRLAGLQKFLATELERGIRHSRNTLDEARAALPFKPSRAELRQLLHEAVERGLLVETERPEDDRKRGSRLYLAPAWRAAA